MNRNRKPFDATGPQARQLTETELENVSGGTIKKTTDQSSPTFFKNSLAGSKLP
jgi:bacteriocin-like protein